MSGHLMIDIETLGTSGNLVPIIQVGLLWFDLAGKTSHDCFSVQLEPQMTVAPPQKHTIEWWEKTNPSLLEAILADPKAIAPSEVQNRIRSFFSLLSNETLVWAKSPSFDLVKLRGLFTAINFNDWVPWSFRNERCVRTIVGAAGTEETPITPHSPVCGIGGDFKAHDALYDCYIQANAVLHAMKKIKVG